MKRYFLIFLFFCPFLMKAQNGLFLGLNYGGGFSFIAKQNAYGYSELDPKVAFGQIAGIDLGINFSYTFGICTGAGYSKFSSKWEGIIRDKITYRTVNLEYIQIPFLLSYVDREDGKFYFQIGPQFGVLRKATQTYDPILNPSDVDALHPGGRPDENGDIMNRFKINDFSLLIRMGSCFNLSESVYMSVGAVLQGSFDDINHPGWRIADHNGTYDKSRNMFIGIQLGLNCSFF